MAFPPHASPQFVAHILSKIPWLVAAFNWFLGPLLRALPSFSSGLIYVSVVNVFLELNPHAVWISFFRIARQKPRDIDFWKTWVAIGIWHPNIRVKVHLKREESHLLIPKTTWFSFFKVQKFTFLKVPTQIFKYVFKNHSGLSFVIRPT